MPNVNDRESTFSGIYCGPMGPFTHDQCIDTAASSFSQRVCGCARSGANCPSSGPATVINTCCRDSVASVRARESPGPIDKNLGGDVSCSLYADKDVLEACKLRRWLETEGFCKKHIVSKLGMSIQGEV